MKGSEPKRTSVPIRFPPEHHRMIKRAADAQGISFSRYVSEAALLRALWDWEGELEPSEVRAVNEAIRLLRDVTRP
jgi:hypothetical protein